MKNIDKQEKIFKEKKMKRIVFIIIIVTSLAAFSGCGKKDDTSGFWNEDDVKIACNDLIKYCIESKQVDEAIKTLGRNPTVVVDDFDNISVEHINLDIINKIMKETIFNSGKLDIVSIDSTEDNYINYFFTGMVDTVIEKDGNKSTRTYIVDVGLFSSETNKPVWRGQYKVRKKIGKPRKL